MKVKLMVRLAKSRPGQSVKPKKPVKKTQTTNNYAEQSNPVSLNAATLTNFLFVPFHPGLLSVPFPVVVSTWQFEDVEELPIRFSTCSNTLPSSITEPETQTKSYLCQY